MNSQLLEKQYSFLQEICHLITATTDINSLANFLLDRAIDYANAEKGSLLLVNERNELYIFAARGFDMQFIDTYRIKLGEGIAGLVAQKRSPVLVEDIDSDERFKGKKRDRYKTRSFISCPLIRREKVLGVININDKKDGTPFTEDEFILLKIIADQAAIALENALLMNQLRTKAAELEEINRKLLESDVDKTEFITRISHELRSPLNSIKGAVYYLQHSEKLKKIKQKEFFDIILTETTGLTSIVDNLIDFLRLESEVMAIKKSLVNLETLLREVCESKSLNTKLSEKNLRFKIDIKEGIYDIVGDKIRLTQLFMNLIEGVYSYVESGETIEISVKENDFIKVDLTISQKIPLGDFSFLFDSRYLFHTWQTDEKIKLYLAKKIAEAHGWVFDAGNTENTFFVALTISKSAREKLEATIGLTMELFVNLMSELMDLNTCSIMLSNSLTGDLTIRGARGLSDEIVKRTRIKIGDQIAGFVAVEGEPLLIEDIEIEPRFKRRSFSQYNTKSLLSLPLKLQDKVIGVVNLNNKKTSDPFTKKDLYLASVISERISYFLEKLYSGEYNEEDINQILTSFDNLHDAVKRYHKKKSIFPELVLRIMDTLGAEENEKKKALYVSMLYDLGLMLFHESILKKKALLPSEIQALKTHPYNTVGLLRSFEFSGDLKKAILHHHERYDGTGYPNGLKGEEIPLISRVIAVVDAFFAMISERPYKKSFTKEEALTEIREGSGSLYDPEIVQAFEKVFQEVMA